MTEVAALASIAKAALQTFSSLAKDELLLLWNSQKELKKLEATINTLTNITYDAEAEGREPKGRTVEDFLSRMRNAMYDAEDLFDRLTAQVLRKRTTGGNKFTKEEAEWVNDIPWNSLSSSLHSLQLSILECENVISQLPDWIPNLNSLNELQIEGSAELRRRCKEGGEDWHLIQHIPQKRITTTSNVRISDGVLEKEENEEEGSRKKGGFVASPSC